MQSNRSLIQLHALQHRTMNEWQLIEDKPSDVKDFIGGRNEARAGQVWVTHCRDLNGFMSFKFDMHSVRRYPTHWMPLPELPKA